MFHSPNAIGLKPEPIPAAAGIGLRGAHHQAFLDGSPAIPWLEVHSENYFAAESVASGVLARIRERYPISLHGVGLSIGSADPLDRQHLRTLKDLVNRVEPGLVSEHLSWGSVGGRHANDLIPLPRNRETLVKTADRIAEVQDCLCRQISIENVSGYIEFAGAEYSDAEFLVSVARRGGCGILLDINNVYVNSVNHGFDPAAYVDSIPAGLVSELHLGGHSTQRYGRCEVLIDTHDSLVTNEVWALYQHAVRRFGRVPTLIEWDANLPPLDVLLGEAARAEQIMEAGHARTA